MFEVSERAILLEAQPGGKGNQDSREYGSTFAHRNRSSRVRAIFPTLRGNLRKLGLSIEKTRKKHVPTSDLLHVLTKGHVRPYYYTVVQDSKIKRIVVLVSLHGD